MLEINDQIRIPEAELHWTFARAGGPGGQNVNKIASKAVLRWNVAGSLSLPDDVRARFRASYKRRITSAGELVLFSQRFREQERNRQDCLEKLVAMLREAAKSPTPRKPLKQPRASREARHRDKRHRAITKASRRAPSAE
jgi:ribosome-associated protein